MFNHLFPAHYDTPFKTMVLDRIKEVGAEAELEKDVLIESFKKFPQEIIPYFEAAAKKEAIEGKNFLRGHRDLIREIFILLTDLFHLQKYRLEPTHINTVFRVTKIFRDQPDALPKSFCIGKTAQQFNNPLLLASQSFFFYKLFRTYNNPKQVGLPYRKEIIAYINNYFLTGKLEKLDSFGDLFDVIKLAKDLSIPKLIRRLPEIVQPKEAEVIPLFRFAVIEDFTELRDHLLPFLESNFRKYYRDIRTMEKNFNRSELRPFCLKGFMNMLKEDLWRVYNQENSSVLVEELKGLNHPRSRNGYRVISGEIARPEKQKEKEKVEESECQSYQFFLETERIEDELDFLEDLRETLIYLKNNLVSFDEKFLSRLNPGQFVLLLQLLPEKVHKINLSYFDPSLLEMLMPLLPPSLFCLNLSHTHITEKLLEAILQKCPDLQVLNLHGCKIDENVGICDFLLKLNKLKSLDIRNCSYFTADKMQYIQKP